MARMSDEDVDVVVLTCEAGPLRPEVRDGVCRQRDVRVALHRVVGRPSSRDMNRWETIARAAQSSQAAGAHPLAHVRRRRRCAAARLYCRVD